MTVLSVCLVGWARFRGRGRWSDILSPQQVPSSAWCWALCSALDVLGGRCPSTCSFFPSMDAPFEPDPPDVHPDDLGGRDRRTFLGHCCVVTPPERAAAALESEVGIGRTVTSSSGTPHPSSRWRERREPSGFDGGVERRNPSRGRSSGYRRHSRSRPVGIPGRRPPPVGALRCDVGGRRSGIRGSVSAQMPSTKSAFARTRAAIVGQHDRGPPVADGFLGSPLA